MVVFGVGAATFRVMAQYDVAVSLSWEEMLSEAVEQVLMRHVHHLMEKPRVSSEVYVAPLMRFGLTTERLRVHDVVLPGREGVVAAGAAGTLTTDNGDTTAAAAAPTSLAAEILVDVGHGKEFVDAVLRSMRGSVVPSMRPAIQALLSILVHTGSTPQQAEDELKLRWFSGEWGSRLQGPNRECTRYYIHTLATWVAQSLYHHRPASDNNNNNNINDTSHTTLSSSTASTTTTTAGRSPVETPRRSSAAASPGAGQDAGEVTPVRVRSRNDAAR